MVLSAMDMISNGFAQTDQTDQAKEVKKDPVDMFYARMNSQTSEYEYDEFDEKDKKKKQKKTCGPIGDLKCYTDAPLYQALCPFFIAMKFVGLFHNKCYKEHWEGKGTPPLSKRITPSSVYCFVGVLVAWSHIGRTLYLFKDNEDGFGPYMFQKFIFLCYTMYCSVNATCCFLACHKYTNIPEFFYEWARLHKEYPGVYFCKDGSRLFAVVMTLVCAAFTITTTVLTVIALFTTNLYDMALVPATGQEDYHNIIRGVVAVQQFFAAAQCYFPLCLAWLMAKILRKEFESFREDFKTFIREESAGLDATTFLCKFERLRRRHNHVCTLVNHVDDFLAPFNGSVFTLCIVMITLILYLIIWESASFPHAFAIAFMWYWLIYSVLTLCIVLVGAAGINARAHAPFPALHEMKFSSKANNQEFHIQLNLFLARLTGEPIGLTAMNLFVIDKPAILTILGMFITYFVILVQFRPGLTSSDAPSIQETICNCTGS